jgi:hypothetical protein
VQSLKRSKGFFGMHLFDTLDPGVLATKVPFYITFLIVAFATYVLSALGFAFVHDTNLKDGFSGFKLRFSRRERGHGKSPKQTEWNEQRSGEHQGNYAEEKDRTWFSSRRRHRRRSITEDA